MRRLFLVLLMVCLTTYAYAVDRHVQKGASNNGSCTSGSPCLDIQQGLDVSATGETILVHPGIYTELIRFGSTKPNRTLKAFDPADRPIIKPPALDDQILRVEPGLFGITVDGMIIDGNNHGNAYCVWLTNGVSFFTLKNSIVQNCSIMGILSSIDSSDNRFEKNVILNNAIDRPEVGDPTHNHNGYLNGPNHVVIGNYFSTATGYNLQCSQHGGCSDTIIDGNTWTDSWGGFTFDTTGNGNIFRNNISFDDNYADGGNRCVNEHTAFGFVKILNNTLVNCGIQVSSDSDGPEIANNILVGDDIDNSSGGTNSHDNLFSNPGLTGAPTPTSPGYRLLSTSTSAIGQAPCRADVPTDIDGNTRPQQGTCDKGADEFTGTVVEGPLHLAWVADPPPTVVVNTNMDPLVIHVHAEDHSLVTTGTGSTASITLSKIGGVGCGTLSCGAGGCTKNASGGVITYSTVQFNATGTDCKLQVASSFDTEPQENTFTVTDPGETPVLTSAYFSTPPSDDTVGVAMTPTVTVQLRDQNNNNFAGPALLVTLSIATGPVGAVISNNTATTSVGTGAATFPLLSFSIVGTYTIQATVPGVASFTSGSFPIGAAPTGIPRLVLAPGANKRYFVSATNTSQAIYMAGTHIWNNLQDRFGETNLDFAAYMTKFNSNWDSTQGGLAKHRLVRLWMWEDHVGGQVVTPNPFMKDASGGTDYNFGPLGNCTLSNPDQPRFNQAYFDRIATRVAQAKAAGVYVSVMLFDPWSNWDRGTGDPWPFHWFNVTQNCNGIDGSPNSFAVGQGYRQGMAITTRAPMKGGPAGGRTINNHNTIWRIQVAYVKKVIDTIHSVAAGGGDNVIYEIANEGGAFSSDWHDDIINEIKAYEGQTGAGACGGQTCKAHLVGKTYLTCNAAELQPFPDFCDGHNDAENELYDSPADWVGAWQTAAYPNEDDDPTVAPESKPNISDSDHGYIIKGDGGFTPLIQWKHFFRGHNLWLMDVSALMTDSGATLASRRALGHIVAYADKVNMSTMVVQGKGTSSPASSGYSLVNAAAGHYMALRLNSTLTFVVPNGTYSCEWFNIDTRVVTSCGTVATTPTAGSQPSGNQVLLLKSTETMAQTLTSIEFITGPSSPTNVNTAMSPVTVRVLDQDSQPYLAAPVSVQMRLFGNPAGVVVSNNTATTSTANGLATFSSLSINVAGSYQFRAVAIVGGEDITDTVSGSFTITSAELVATTLTFTTQPTTTAQGAIMAPVQVTVFDQNGAPYTDTSITVTIRLLTFPAAAVLSGTLSKATNASGIAIFDNLSLNIPATNYSLEATMPPDKVSPPSSVFTITTPTVSVGTVGVRATRGLMFAH